MSLLKKEDLVIFEFSNGSELIVVPSKHFDLGFTSLVNCICADPLFRPEAIAVELPHLIASQIGIWMQELGVSPAGKFVLPVMLALSIKNNLFHPDKSGDVKMLEEYYKTNLNLIQNQEVVLKTLQHSSELVVALSNTDSIIEGIRCAIELDNIPVFGVDMNHCSGIREGQLILEEFDASHNIKRYMENNSVAVSKIKDDFIDSQREIFIASRVKSLSEVYKKRVLLIIGMAHWSSIQTLLSDKNLKPVENIPDMYHADNTFTRAILAPSVGSGFIHKYPSVSPYYEKHRPHPLLNEPQVINPPYEGIFRNSIYERTKEKFQKISFSGSLIKSLALDQLLAFEKMLSNMSFLNQSSIPSMRDILNISQSVFPKRFTIELTNTFMEIDWATQEKFPGLPVISPDRETVGEGNSTAKKYNFFKGTGNSSGKNISMRFHGIESPFVFDFRSEDDDDFLRSEIRKRGRSSWVWPPLEVELYLLGLRAIELSEDERRSVLFAGSLENGINAKRTIKSFAQNKSEIYVNGCSSIKPKKQNSAQPVVYIFNCAPALLPHERIYDAGIFAHEFIKNKEEYHNYTSSFGTNFVANISYFMEKVEDDAFDVLAGDLSFGSPFINTMQSAAFIERHKFRATPVIKSFSISALDAWYLSSFNLIIGADWKQNLIIYALPFCYSGNLIVVAPEEFKPSQYAVSQARKRNVEIKLVPLSFFPEEKVQHIRRRILVQSTDDHGLFYPPEADELLGESYNHNFNMLPHIIRTELDKIYKDFAYLKSKVN